MLSAALIPTGSGPARHPWRGLHLDSTRTFWPVDVVLELLETMARYRLNWLHWHLTDDAGWRFDVPSFPNLVRVGAYLPREPFEWYTNINHDKRIEALKAAAPDSTHGWYRDEDISRIVEHARHLDIAVMPEVDLPGHMAAAIRAYPELGDPALADLPPEQWSHRNDLLWPGDQVEVFVRDALDRVCELFDCAYVHIGGDECNYELWEADANLMRICPPAEHQRRFTDFARTHLLARGRKTALWDDALSSELSGDELVFAWRYDIGVPLAKDSGHPWVYADAASLYLNHLAGPEETEPAGMREVVTAKDVLASPVPEEALGVQAACWTEFITDRAGLHYHLFPRLLAVAELAWNGPSTDWETFESILRREVTQLSKMGIHGRAMDD